MSFFTAQKEIADLRFVKLLSRKMVAEAIVRIGGCIVVKLAGGKYWTNGMLLDRYAYPNVDARRQTPVITGLHRLGAISKAAMDEHLARVRRNDQAETLKSDQKTMDELAKTYGFESRKLSN